MSQIIGLLGFLILTTLVGARRPSLLAFLDLSEQAGKCEKCPQCDEGGCAKCCCNYVSPSSPNPAAEQVCVSSTPTKCAESQLVNALTLSHANAPTELSIFVRAASPPSSASTRLVAVAVACVISLDVSYVGSAISAHTITTSITTRTFSALENIFGRHRASSSPNAARNRFAARRRLSAPSSLPAKNVPNATETALRGRVADARTALGVFSASRTQSESSPSSSSSE